MRETQRVVQLQGDVRILGRVRQRALEADLVEADLAGALPATSS